MAYGWSIVMDKIYIYNINKTCSRVRSILGIYNSNAQNNGHLSLGYTMLSILSRAVYIYQMNAAYSGMVNSPPKAGKHARLM